MFSLRLRNFTLENPTSIKTPKIISKKLRDKLFFLQEAGRNHTEVGSFWPSSRFLSSELTSIIKDKGDNRRILEVGPGVGPVTIEILKKLSPNDKLTICEINEPLLERLKVKLQTNPLFIKHKNNIEFYLGPVQDLAKEKINRGEKFDLIISSLPFSIFPSSLVDEIFALYWELLSPTGSISFFEYLLIRKARALFQVSKSGKLAKEVESVVTKWKNFCKQHGTVQSHAVFFNIPPAQVIKLIKN